MDKAKIKRVLFALIAIFIIIYVIYVFISSVFDVDGIETEIATEITATDTLYKDAIIIRNEKLIKNDTEGIISYTSADGDKVAKGEQVAKVYNSEDDVLAYQELQSINSEIKRLRKLSASVTNGDLGIDTINSLIYNAVSDLNKSIADRDFIDSDSQVDNLSYLVTERLMVTGDNIDISNRLNELKERKAEIQSSAENAVGVIKTEKAGCFVSNADGYESVYKCDDVSNINITKFNELKNAKPKKVSEDTVGKIVTSVNWYILCPVTESEALKLTKSSYDKVTINLPFASSSSIPATVESINQDAKGGDSVLVMKCNYMNSELASIRKENVEICLNTYEGLRVNKSALHDGIVKKITEDENNNQITKKKAVQGVYVLYGNELQFKEVSILYSGSDFVICDPSPDSGVLFNGKTISLYDNVVVEGSDLKDGKIIN